MVVFCEATKLNYCNSLTFYFNRNIMKNNKKLRKISIKLIVMLRLSKIIKEIWIKIIINLI
jgi:hypothetical protein